MPTRRIEPHRTSPLLGWLASAALTVGCNALLDNELPILTPSDDGAATSASVNDTASSGADSEGGTEGRNPMPSGGMGASRDAGAGGSSGGTMNVAGAGRGASSPAVPDSGNAGSAGNSGKPQGGAMTVTGNSGSGGALGGTGGSSGIAGSQSACDCEPGETSSRNVECPCNANDTKSQSRTCLPDCTWGAWIDSDTNTCDCCNEVVFCGGEPSNPYPGTWCRHPDGAAPCTQTEVTKDCYTDMPVVCGHPIKEPAQIDGGT